MKYRKKPVEVQAVQWTGRNFAEVGTLAPAMLDIEQLGDGKLHIPTLEGMMTASCGDYIIRGVKGEVYSCREDIFLMTYEPVEEPQV